MSDGDAILRQKIGVTSVPSGRTAVTSSVVTIPAGEARSFLVQTTPDSNQLGIWNYLFSIVVDALTLDINSQYANVFPYGTGITAAQLKCRVTNWVDWAGSSDTSNTRQHIIRIENTDSSSHDYYLFYKAYTFATSRGAAT